MKRMTGVGEWAVAIGRRLGVTNTEARTVSTARKLCGRLLGLVCLGALALSGRAAYGLTAGDVSIIGYRTDATDGFAFVTWVDLPTGASLSFTDSGFFSDGTLRDSENVLSWTAPAGGIAAGSVVVVSCASDGSTADAGTASGQFDGLAASGDQIFAGDTAFSNTGDTSVPGSTYTGTLLFGLATEKAWLTSGELSGSNDSFLPAALSGASVRLTKDNGQYTGARSGLTVAQFKTAVMDPSNWTVEDSGTTVLDSTDFVIDGGAPAVAITDPAEDSLTVPNGTAARDLSGSSANAVGFLTWSNALTEVAGTVDATTAWTIAGIGLDVGDNVITVTATNAAGQAAADSVTVIRQQALLPVLTVTDPSAETTTVDNAVETCDFAGSAQNLVGTMTWSNSLTAATGSFEAEAAWRVSGVALAVGDNTFTFSGTNVNGEAASDAVTVRRLPVQVLAAGDIAFVAYNADGQDGFAIVALKDIPADTTIYFCDTEWSGSAWVDGEGKATWTTPSTPVSAGTVVRFYCGSTDMADLGTYTDSMSLGNSDEGLFCYLGLSSTEPTTFLAAVGNGTEATSFGTLSGTGLTLGDTAFLFGDDWDVAQYVGERSGLADFASYRAVIYDAANWEHQDDSGDQNADGVAPDEPFDATVFAVGEPAAAELTVETADAVVPYGTASITVEGVAANIAGLIMLTNSLGVAQEMVAETAWSFADVALTVGVNTITVTASNSVGGTVSDKVTIIRQAAAAEGGSLRLAAFSDPHYFATNLLVNDGTAFQTYIAQDRKLIAESAAITHEVISQIIAQNPNVVLVSGDLTKDGELDSHVAFSNELARLEAAGAQVLVIPGNHDINNPSAVSYDGAATTPVTNVSPEQFKAIYAPFGYDLAVATDSASVGYAVELTPEVTLLCMDSCEYGATAGSFDTDRLAWITNQLAAAHAQGRRVIGMMHHGLLEHFQGQKTLFSEYVLDDYQTVAPLFASLGMKAVFTGHFHANDVVAGAFDGRTIYDIETGSTVTWPCPYRIMELGTNGTLTVATHRVGTLDYALNGAPDFQTYAHTFLTNGMETLTSYMLQASPFYLDAATAGYLAPAVTEAMVDHYAGDEPGLAGASAETQVIVGNLLAGDAQSQQLGGAIYAILTDPAPADNDLTLDLSTPPVAIMDPEDGATLGASEAIVVLTVDTLGLVGELTYLNETTGLTLTGAVDGESPALALAYGLNVLTVSGTNAAGRAYSATVTVTREAPTPADGENVSPAWDYTVATGAVHVAWTTNDWYQFQTLTACLPGEFAYLDPFGGETEPGDGEPVATTLGATTYRYDATDMVRCAAVSADGDFSVRVPCFGSGAIGSPINQDVVVRVTYWDAPGNPDWVQGWELAVTPEGGIATEPVLVGRVHSTNGLITEAYGFAATNVSGGIAVTFSADPALADGNPAYVSEVAVDTLAHAPLLVTGPADGSSVSASVSELALTLSTAGLVGELTYLNETTGLTLTGAVDGESPALALAYGLNVLTVSGTNAAGQAYSATVTVTREAPTPANGADVSPAWDYTVATGAVHVAWTTNDWYQFQTLTACLPGEFAYLDLFGGEAEPGDGEPIAATLGATTYRYDAADMVRCAAVSADGDFSVRVPAYDVGAVGVPMNAQVLVRVTYWDAPGNPDWVQDWELAVTPEGGVATEPVLVGRVHSTNGLITEAYGFAVTNVSGGIAVTFSADPALADGNPAYVSEVAVDTLAAANGTAHVVRTVVEGEGTATPACVMVADGAETNIEVAVSGEWRRIQALTTNGIAVAEAEALQTYTLQLTGVTGDYDNRVVIGYRPDSENPDGVPTGWLAAFGRNESEACISSDRSVADKYRLDIDPYQTEEVMFDIDEFAAEDGSVRVVVRLLIDGAEHDHINGSLRVEGRPTLSDDWSVIEDTPVTGAVFESGRHQYEIPVGTNRFFRAVIH